MDEGVRFYRVLQVDIFMDPGHDEGSEVRVWWSGVEWRGGWTASGVGGGGDREKWGNRQVWCEEQVWLAWW